MSMPETAVHEDARPVPTQHDVRLAGQSWVVQSVAEAQTEEELPHNHLRLRVLAFYGSHVIVALFCGVYVGHTVVMLFGNDQVTSFSNKGHFRPSS
jgi:hypothetical protein